MVRGNREEQKREKITEKKEERNEEIGAKIEERRVRRE